MTELFRQFFWLIFPIFGMGCAAFAIWNEFGRQKRALDVLKVYAEKGVEPPESVLAVLNRASASSEAPAKPNNSWASFAFYLVMALGFAGACAWFNMGDVHDTWVFVAGTGITAFVMAALALSNLVRALTSRGQNDR